MKFSENYIGDFERKAQEIKPQPTTNQNSYGKGGSVPDDQFDPEQLAKGTKIEMEEHGLDMETAKKICKDHLLESPTYYSDKKD